MSKRKRTFIFHLSKLSIILVCLGYLLFNIIFTHTIWRQVLYPEKQNEIIIQGESSIYEFVAETVRLNILSGKNPFTSIESVLYPLGWNFALEDIAPMNGFYFLLLRPFLQIHQSMMLILVINIFLSNVSMYLLLRFLKIRKDVAFLAGFMYGFTPWVSLRIGAHPSYTALYVFPLITHCFLYLINSKRNKTLAAILLAGIMAITVLTNLYFTVMMVVLTTVAFFIFLILDKKTLYQVITDNVRYIILTCISALILLTPWITESYRGTQFSQYKKPTSLVDAITYSADVFNIILPSYGNPFIKPFLKFISKAFPYANRGVFEGYIYPGIIILVGYTVIFYYWKKQRKITKILVITSMCMLILTFGPFLQVYGKNLYIPLPYIVLHYIPYLQMARAPGRFIILFIFLACVVISMGLHAVLNKISKKRQLIIFFILFCIAIVDQSFQGGPPLVLPIPNKIFSYLDKKEDPTQSSVLNIPFTIRDGLQSLGYYHGVWFTRTQLLFRKPIFSIYAGRLSDDTFRYYQSNVLFALLDKAINTPNADYESLFKSADVKGVDKTMRFLDINYVILDTREKYYPFVLRLLKQVGLNETLSDKNYLLMSRSKLSGEFFPKTLYAPEDQFLFEKEWTPFMNGINGGRWINGNKAIVVFKTNKPRPIYLHFLAKTADKSQNVSIYMNKQHIKDFRMENGFKRYDIVLDSHIRKGVNFIMFRFPNTVEPAAVLPDNKDKRQLAAFFSDFQISDKQVQYPRITGENVSITFDNKEDEISLLEGWSVYEAGARWVEGTRAKVQFVTNNPKISKLTITAESLYKPQETKVYINDKYVGKFTIETGKTDQYTIDTKNSIQKGTNIVTFQFSRAHRIGTLLVDTKDFRMLSTYVKSITLK